MKPVPFRQSGMFGCGRYAIANTLNDPHILIGVEMLKRNDTIAGLNILMHTLWGQYEELAYLDAQFLCNGGLEVQNRLTDVSMFELRDKHEITDEERAHAIPYMITVKTKRGYHAFAAFLNIATLMVHVVDSNNQFIYVMSPEKMLEHYHVVGVCVWVSWDDEENNQIHMAKKELPHIFNDDE